MFSDVVNKINRSGGCDRRAIVVTGENVYKHDPKNYKVKKDPTPIVAIDAIRFVSQFGSFV